jgi:hypothetical protein
MKRIAILLGLTTAALAQQPKPFKVRIGPDNSPAPRTTGALQKRCPDRITVTDSYNAAEYRLNLSFYIGPTVFQYHYNGVLFDAETGEALTTFETHSIKQLSQQVCRYFESLTEHRSKPGNPFLQSEPVEAGGVSR